MKKELDITRIMDDYTDNEFFVEGEQAVDTEKAVGDLLAKVQPRKKKMKPLFKALIAAAVAVVLAGTATAAAVIINSGVFTGASGTEYNYFLEEDGFGMSWHGADIINDLMTLEDGRLYLNVDGGHIDITERIDRRTPYIYPYTVPETGDIGYVIAGGTTEEYGVVELTYIAGYGWMGNGAVNSDYLSENNGDCIDVRVGEEVVPAEIHGANHHFSVCYRDMSNEQRHQHIDRADTIWAPYSSTFHQTVSKAVDWREECVDAWIIEALVQLDLIELYE